MEDRAVLIFNVDAVVTNYVSHVHNRLSGRETGIVQGDGSRFFEIAQLNAVGVGRIHIVVEMEIVSRHLAVAVARDLRSQVQFRLVIFCPGASPR